MAINNSIIRANLANQSGALTRGGGGVFNADGASMTINDSQILDNIVDDGSVTAFGGGIYSGAGSVLFVDNSVIDGNRADGRALVATNDALGQGGGIWTQGNLSLEQSTVSNNTAIGEFARGGGIHTEGQTLDIDRSLIFANLAESRTQAFSGGGGLSVGANSDDNVIRDSVISSNRTDGNGLCRGGGICGDSGFLILRSSIANNQAICNDGDGGGVSFSGNGEIVNSTVINNQANNDGGGIHVINSSGSVVKIRSSTVVQNTANADGNAAGFGGGVAVQAGFADLGNSVLAGNINSNNSVDCSGNLSSVGNNLIQTASFCTFGTQSSDQLNINALLAAAANNGGPIAGSSLGVIAGVLTRAPLPSSTLIDRGDASGCKDHTNQVLTTDQVGRARAIDGPDPDTIARCDIGAVEYQDTLFAGGFEGPA